MHEYKKVLESKMKIRFHDCDPFNHLNNARYIDYIVTARGDQLLDNYDLDIYRLAREKAIGWVSAQTQISYLVPAMVMEEVTIQTQLISFSDKSLVFEGLMWNNDTTQLKAVMWTKLVHFSLTHQKSHNHSAELIQLFQQIVNPLVSQVDFETRVKNLRPVDEPMTFRTAKDHS
ncbi:acyl-CoA thioesterase [Pollutibacter soli]|uniref:acyl-CoA thioesterase n=1 Tax=Pollutibacter soli TaxID=3034157 RepID=UPI0030138FAC